ncbi:hypothetical protein [Patulibacter americanus]|uniref:hypothetical protein n=1 Tax=Patulibacter americanus TaxID=588672 RepID=UPI0003B4E78B|nr:hypothetical protein [Patulibacter americanus]
MRPFLGLVGYQPRHLASVDELTGADRARLRGLVGTAFPTVWAVWDTDDDARFADAPVVLDRGAGPGGRLELAAFKTELCVSCDSIDLAAPIDWYGTGLDLRWRSGVLPEAERLRDRTITGVSLIAFDGDLVGFAFEAGTERVELFNALDELGIRATRGAAPGLGYLPA